MIAKSEERIAYTVAEAAELCGLSAKTVYEACQRGQFPHVRVGRKILVPRRRFLVWLNGDLPPRDLPGIQSVSTSH